MAEDATTGQTSIKPVERERPFNLIPVGLKEAALDSPTFRATVVHFAEQIEIIERWLEGYVKAAARLVAEVSGLENVVNGFLKDSLPPAGVSEAVLDHDYSLLAMRRYGEGAREVWGGMIRGVRRYDTAVVEPIRAFLNNELRGFKDARRVLEMNQKSFDGVIGRYLSQSKTKEASSLREDAFQVHEARKAYLKASMEFCTAAPQLRASLDQLIVRIFSEQWKEMRNVREASAATFTKLSAEMERVRGWSREMENSERAFKRELMTARRQIEERAELMTRPSRDMADYEASTVPYLGTAASINKTGEKLPKGEKQSWLFMKTVVGKPARAVWNRRWFFVKNGIFGWLVQGSRSGGVEESEKIGVLLCGVRPAFQEERRFCFEVKTKDTSIILQAETQAELSEWINAFEIAKRKALEDPASTMETLSPGVVDPAFAISPPVAPEFAARFGEGTHGEESSSIAGGLSVPSDQIAGMAITPTRASFDVNSSRRVMSLEREPGEGNRDHAARIIQKLDLHKRSTAASPQISQGGSSMSGAAGGIASLISASHNIFPVPPIAPQQQSTGAGVDATGLGHRRNFSGIPISTLAPSTLANPPAPTNLSNTAVVVSGERGIGLGRADGSGMPSGIMANLWGSSNWGYVNRIGGDAAAAEKAQQRSAAPQPSSPPRLTTVDDVGVMDGTGEMAKENSPLSPDVGSLRHRKTLSIADPTTIPSTTATTQANDKIPVTEAGGDQYPNYYPLPLKVQQAQFCTLFPSVPRGEKVVLVFRATWNPNEQQEFPGRVYVTVREIYFYSNHIGLVLITGVGLASIAEVTAAPGRDCDFLYLHLKDGGRNGEERRRITVRVFLDMLSLLQRRLRFLVENANLETPVGLEEVLKTLTKMEVEKPERSSSLESWEDLTYDPAADERDAAAGDSPPQQRRRERNVKASLRIDGTLFGEPSARTGRELQKFQLPRQAVVYAPQGMRASVTREFNVSAKALFHVMFGDKSAVFQLLYCNRWADKIVQSPWTKSPSPNAAEGGHGGAGGTWRRHFESKGRATPMADSQAIEILNDHLCYVVSNHKDPWRLPYASRFHLITKYVITHSAKSRCKLAIFQQISWTKPPASAYVRALIEKQALNSLEADALDLSNVAMDQVGKLGSHSKTNKAIEIFGNVGQQTNVPQLDTATMTNLGGSVAVGRIKQRQPVGLPALVAADVVARLLRGLSFAFDVLVALGKGAAGVFTAHAVLVALLAGSVLWNSWYGYREGIVWWQERSARDYMARMGVRPEHTIARAVHLADIEEMIAPVQIVDVNKTVTILPFLPSASSSSKAREDGAGRKSCRSTFGEQLSNSTSMAAVGGASGARLHRSRDALARYRHDLLVALRVVNRVERDVVLAEWEDWVQAEERKCARVENMLRSRAQRQQANKSGNKGKNVEMGVEELDAELGAEFVEYCASCRSEVAGLDDEMRTM